ncbi:HesA/MoeB/ThiF family protein [Pseudozobellia thermophila]|uniref:Molybdopterin-synthase adenylyltransferase n=1 Tax=Pseudozobellia thermophila TaxID=192903 RepID=A0A1M6J2T2_9FLAO|nr:HesA/MoeB/ThiF family protein [Pseudozobellia thermophila]SHJ40972.1 adenylyltransferase and sulfurtransferase [Pseudozobellia thermophila]
MERYQRQIQLSDFGREAQEKLMSAKVLVVGAGGLGIPILMYLNAMGVGTLGIVDQDRVSVSNLHRQVLFSEGDVEKPKVGVLARKLREQNSATTIVEHPVFLTKENAMELIDPYDLVVDASDNFSTRYLVNDACVIQGKPFVYGALHGFEGQVSVFNYNNGPTYRCLFPNMPKSDEVPNCNEHGVLGILPGIIGNLQALEAVKALTGVGEVLAGTLLLFNGLTNTFRKIRFRAQRQNFGITRLKDSYELACAADISGIAPLDFLKLVERQRLQLIDVRTEKEFKRNHLPLAKNIPLAELETRLGEIDFGSEVYCICQSGIRSKKAIRKMQMSNPNARLIDITGGMNQIPAHALKC